MNAAARGYWTRPADLAADHAAIVDFWQRHLGDPDHRAAKFDWFYAHCPFGQPLIQLIYHDSELVGCCGVAPRRMLWEGQEIRAGLLADMAVAPSHRTLGPALMLQEALIESAHGHFDLLYGFPNHKSLPVVARLHYAMLGTMTRYSRVLRMAPYLKRFMPPWLATPAGMLLDGVMALRDAWRKPRGVAGVETTWATSIDGRIDALWHASVNKKGLFAVRDARMLRWRFDQSPLGDTRYLLLASAAGGKLQAWFACQIVGSVLRVCDWWPANGDGDAERKSLFVLVHAARRAGCSSISLECATSALQLATLVAAGFVAREGQPVVGRWLDRDGAAIDLHDNGHVTEIDEDE